MLAKIKIIGGAIAALIVLILVSGSAYTISEIEQVIITQFGKPVGKPITQAGLHFKVPFVQKVIRIDRRILEWDGPLAEMPTRDKLYIFVDTFGRWRIKDPLKYYLKLNNERSALDRLEDILGSETRNAIANHDLIEVIRTTKDRIPDHDEAPGDALAESPSKMGVLPPITKGRTMIEVEIRETARQKLADFGIDLLDVRFKRINYNKSVVEKIYERMISERQQIASRFRSEGEGEAAKIFGSKERDLDEIASVAYKEIQKIRGEADARAIEIYAQAYNQSPEARDLYEFLETMKTYKVVLGSDTTLILSTSSELFRFLNRATGDESD